VNSSRAKFFLLLLAMTAWAALSAGCAATTSAPREPLVYVPPMGDSAVGRWLPLSEAPNPTITPLEYADPRSLLRHPRDS
jgi:hypothetical protein